MTLRCIVPDALWLLPHPTRFFGVPVRTHMTVVQLANGALWLHSPVPLDAPTIEQLSAFGEPAFIVAPNREHHMYVDACRRAFPRARVFVVPGLLTKRPDLQPCTVLGDEAPVEWANQMEQLRVRGIPHLDEVVFLHRATGTLVLTDLCFRIGDDAPPVTRTLARVLGIRELAMSRTMKLLVRDRAALRTSVGAIRQWRFDRVIVAHEGVIESSGAAAFAAAMAFLG